MQATRKHPTAISHRCPTPPPPSARHLDVGLHGLHHLPYALLPSPLHTPTLYLSTLRTKPNVTCPCPVLHLRILDPQAIYPRDALTLSLSYTVLG